MRAAALAKEGRELRAVQSTLLGAVALAASLALSASPSMAEPKLPPLDTGEQKAYAWGASLSGSLTLAIRI